MLLSLSFLIFQSFILLSSNRSSFSDYLSSKLVTYFPFIFYFLPLYPLPSYFVLLPSFSQDSFGTIFLSLIVQCLRKIRKKMATDWNWAGSTEAPFGLVELIFQETPADKAFVLGKMAKRWRWSWKGEVLNWSGCWSFRILLNREDYFNLE